MEEAIDRVIRLFYNGNSPKIKDVQVLNWSPETEFITVRWKEGDSCITVKSFDYGVKKVITRLR
jgi:hypothetical protein